jgi:hypothetical protein
MSPFFRRYIALKSSMFFSRVMRAHTTHTGARCEKLGCKTTSDLPNQQSVISNIIYPSTPQRRAAVGKIFSGIWVNNSLALELQMNQIIE